MSLFLMRSRVLRMKEKHRLRSLMLRLWELADTRKKRVLTAEEKTELLKLIMPDLGALADESGDDQVAGR